MEIKYLSQLNNNPTYKKPGSDYVKKLRAIPLDEIVNLENSYNNGNKFPQALSELLYLAGNYCYVLDYSVHDTQTEMQDDARSLLTEFNRFITRPFFVIDMYNGAEQFLFIYLDEGKDDPQVYSAFLPSIPHNSTIWITPLRPATLSGFIAARMERLLSGYNPF